MYTKNRSPRLSKINRKEMPVKRLLPTKDFSSLLERTVPTRKLKKVIFIRILKLEEDFSNFLMYLTIGVVNRKGHAILRI